MKRKSFKEDGISESLYQIRQYLIRCRKENGWTQRNMAMLLDVAPTTISAFETGKSCPLSMVLDYCLYVADFETVYEIYNNGRVKNVPVDNVL